MIDGAYRILYLKYNGSYLPVSCLTSESFSENSEMLDTTTRDNGGWKTSTPTMQGYNISFEGLVLRTIILGQENSGITQAILKNMKRTGELIEWKIQSSTDIYVSSGKGHITSISDNSSIDEFISFNAEIEGYGAIVESTIELSFLQSNLQIEL